jgi:CHAT domain-containing protein
MALTGAGTRTLELVEPEIQGLASLLPEATVQLRATRQVLLDALATSEAVHLAGHALYLDGAPSASGLRLEDGFVTIHDLAAAAIRARMVTFGVCSGVRLQEAEPHRFEGFLRVLLASGVRNVVGPTGWVHDEHAHQFALAFYSCLERSRHPAQAFREAISALRAQDSHPVAWGSYQLYGDGRQWRAR